MDALILPRITGSACRRPSFRNSLGGGYIQCMLSSVHCLLSLVSVHLPAHLNTLTRLAVYFCGSTICFQVSAEKSTVYPETRGVPLEEMDKWVCSHEA